QWCKWVARSSSSFVGEISTSVLGALDVGAVRRHDHDLGPRADEGRNHGAHAVRQQRGLVGGRGSLPFHRRLGLHHLQGGLLGKLDRDRHPLVHGEHDLHFRLEIGGLVADDVGGQRHLVGGLRVYRMEAGACLVQVLMLAILHVGAFDLLGRLEALRHLYAVADAAHVDLRGGGALAGMEAFGIEDGIELALEFDDIALAERAGDDFHGEFSSIIGRTRPRLGPNVGPHHTDLAADRQSFSRRLDRGTRAGWSVPDAAALLGSARRPTALPARAHANCRGLAAIFRGAGFRRGRDRDAGAFAGERNPSPRLRNRSGSANGYARAILSANLARIRLQKIAGGRRTAHRRVRPLVSQPRARRPAPSRIHHGRMVSGPGALRGPDGGLRSYSCARGGGGGLEAVLVPRSRHRSVRRARAADGGGSVCVPRRHRSLGNAAAAARGRLRRRRPCRRRPHGGRRYLGRHFQPRAGREDRTSPRARARDDPLRISGGAIAARPAEKPRATARRALRALRLRGRACERLRRTHRRGRATQTAPTPDGGKGAHLRSALSDRRGFSERPCGDAGGLRDCARLRSAGAARDRSRSHRRGDVDAHVRDVNDREMKGQRMLPFRAELRIFIVVAAAARAQPAWAQAYATQNITLQVAFAAGGIADVVARLVGQKLSERFGQVVVVENRGGAGGNLAAKAVSGAAPDGYTILATTTSLAVNETATKNKGFSVGELRAIAIVAFSPDVLAVHPSNPAKDLNEFIDNGKNR